MLISNKPVLAAMRPFAGSSAGAFACGIAPAGARTGRLAADAYPRPRSAAASAASVILGQHQASIRTQSEQYLTLIAPVTPGEVGPHPVREPEPV